MLNPIEMPLIFLVCALQEHRCRGRKKNTENAFSCAEELGRKMAPISFFSNCTPFFFCCSGNSSSTFLSWNCGWSRRETISQLLAIFVSVEKSIQKANTIDFRELRKKINRTCCHLEHRKSVEGTNKTHLNDSALNQKKILYPPFRTG